MSPIPSLREESREAGWVPGEETPGICGMSALKRSDGGLSDIIGCALSLYWKPSRYSKRKESRMLIPTGPAMSHPPRHRLVTLRVALLVSRMSGRRVVAVHGLQAG